MQRRILVVPVAIVAVLGFTLIAWGAPKTNPVDAILALLTNPDYGLEEIKAEVRTIEETLSPASFTLSSGVFGLPTNAASVDWVIVNNAPTDQTFTVRVYEVRSSGKTLTPPGAITRTIAPGHSWHNANSVGSGGPFHLGGYYEVEVDVSHPNLLPTVVVWDTSTVRVIPGTSIQPGSWVRLR